MNNYWEYLNACAETAQERGEQYGSVEKNFGEILTILDTCFGVKMDLRTLCQVMMATKISRNKHKYKEDNVRDLINYAAIMQYFEEKKKEQLL